MLKNKFIVIFLLLFIRYKYLDNDFCDFDDPDKISIVINMKNLTYNKYLYFNQIFKIINTTRNFYFIKICNGQLNQNLNKLVSNNSVKIVQSNFPDSIFLSLVVYLYGNNIPE